MKYVQKIIYILIPYAAAELLQFYLLTFAFLFKGLVRMPDNLEILLSASVAGIVGIIFFVWYRYDNPGKKAGSLRALFTTRHISLLLLLGIGCQFFFSAFMTLIRPFFEKIFSNYSQVIEKLTEGSLAVVLLYMIIIAPVSEELIFRGLIMHKAGRYYEFAYANILQAILFGLYHGNLVQGIYAALIGLILGLVCHSLQSLIASIALHMIINASSLLVALIPDMLPAYIISTLAGGGLMAAALNLIYMEGKKRELIGARDSNRDSNEDGNSRISE